MRISRTHKKCDSKKHDMKKIITTNLSPSNFDLVNCTTFKIGRWKRRKRERERERERERKREREREKMR